MSTGEGTSGYRDIGGVPGTGGNRRRPGGGTVPPPIPVPAAWQRPYLNIFKHFRVEEWKRSAREGDVAALTVTGAPAPRGRGVGDTGCRWAALTLPPLPNHPFLWFRKDARLKGTVYRIRGSVPTSSYLQLPRTGTQSLGLAGRYLYLLFKPMPCKHFVVHLDVATEVRDAWRPR